MKIPKEFIEKIKDTEWRINNLYKIKNKDGEVVTFKFNEHQKILYDNFHTRNIVPKSRQLGVTTLMTVVYLDATIFQEHKKAVIIAKDETSLKEIFRDKVLFSLNNLPSWVKHMFEETNTQTQKMVTFKNGSSFMVQTSARSGTVNYLHVSELGLIDANNPVKADEVISGSLNAIHTNYKSNNMITIESTSGGPKGHFYNICMKSEQLRLKMKSDQRLRLSANDYKVMFLPWWFAKEYEDDSAKEVTVETERYFRGLVDEKKDGEVMEFSMDKKRWWQTKKEEQGPNMSYEYPSTFSEAFSIKRVGVIYNDEMRQLFEDGRYTTKPYRPEYYVDTWWDLGVSDKCVIIFTQTIDSVIYIIDVYADNGKGLEDYVKVLNSKGYVYNYMHLPWDGQKRDIGSAKTPKQILSSLGVSRVRIAPKISIEDGINNTKSVFRRVVMNELKCHSLKDAMKTYRRKFDTLNSMFTTPIHDDSSHYADAMRTLGVMWRDYNSTIILDNESKGNQIGEVDYQNVFD